MLLPLAFKLHSVPSLAMQLSTPLLVDELGDTVDVGEERNVDALAGGPGSLRLRFRTSFRLSRERPAETGSQHTRVDIGDSDDACRCCCCCWSVYVLLTSVVVISRYELDAAADQKGALVRCYALSDAHSMLRQVYEVSGTRWEWKIGNSGNSDL